MIVRLFVFVFSIFWTVSFGNTPVEKIKESEKKVEIENRKPLVDLEVYGLSFINNSSSNTTQTKIVPPDSYQMRVGDDVEAKVYGFDNLDMNFTIKNDGTLYIPKYGPIKIVGETYSSAKKMLKDAFKQIYPNSDTAISIKSLSPIEVSVSGMVKNPGVYFLSGFSTVIDALRVAGGVQEKASVRDIVLIRNGNRVNIDLYEYIDGENDFSKLLLRDGDFIVVKNSKYRVSIDGAVKRPAIYELNKNSSIEDLMNLSKGFSSNANRKNIVLKRFYKDKGVMFSYIDIDKDKNFKLQDGDYISVSAFNKNEEDLVEIKGEVVSPGKYLFENNMSVGRLITMAEGFTPKANKDNILITRSEIINNERVLKSIKVDSLDFILEPFDVVHVYKFDNWNTFSTIEIKGAVRSPGKYILDRNATLRDVINLANGFGDDADLYGVKIYRSSLKTKQIELKQRKISELRAELSSVIFGSVYENIDYQSNKIKIMNIEKQISELQNSLSQDDSALGVISLNLGSNKGKMLNFKLLDGDVVVVPQKEYYIYVEGEVLKPTVVPYQNGMSVIEYINKSGGFTKMSDINSSYILRRSGEADRLVFDKNQKSSQVLRPGDIIVIGSKR